jgi:hypothetical protein
LRSGAANSCRGHFETIALSFRAASTAQTIAASTINSITARERPLAVATWDFGYCGWNGLLRCAP